MAPPNELHHLIVNDRLMKKQDFPQNLNEEITIGLRYLLLTIEVRNRWWVF